MTVYRVNEKRLFLASSTDISANKIEGVGNVGWSVITIDNMKHYLVAGDLTLIETGDSAVALSSSESFIGTVGNKSNVLDYTLVLDANNAYAIGDTLAICASIGNFFRVNGGTATILGVRLLDEEKQAADLDIVLFKSMVDIGTINQPYNITDEEAREIIGTFSFAAADYTAWTNFSTAFLAIGDPGFKVRVVKGVSDSRAIYIAAICKSAKTFTSGGSLKLSIQYIND
jgi:hypothetical protein